MIELNEKTQQDFLNREWAQKLLDAGIDMSDAKYYIATWKKYYPKPYMIFYRSELETLDLERCKASTYEEDLINVVPTYTVSELLYKLHEWIYPTIDGEKFSGGLKMLKDAPFYIFYYALKTKEYDPQLQQGNYKEDYIYAEFEYPIESLASLLIQCHQKDIGIKDKTGKQISDTGNISDK